ncbi:hypothetical protein [Streptomyces niveus]|uniref:hypothetical protein n=1 Tax=Streptomyces niveus TaxID=193462 RepID=UPI003430F2FE
MDEKPHQQFQAAADPVGEIDWAVAADKAYSNGPRHTVPEKADSQTAHLTATALTIRLRT